ncbi:autism susceptibility gene 2 protein-like [Callorhinchus milii]|uniref:autism susceptibility gene 2 protein-like n=1 Tax=Callorhinchus milii TaxID=7868 RepID=UPI001C3FDEA8|nr:autism susceptibility gene 2 protein-like [Callorhinchus milii]
MDGPRASVLRRGRRSRAQRNREQRAKGGRGGPRVACILSSSGSEREDSSKKPGLSRPRPPRRRRKASMSGEEDLIDGFAITSFITLEGLEKDTTLKPSEHMDTAQNPLVKKTRNQLHNGLRFHPNKKRHNFHNGNSDRENNPSLSRGQGQRKPFHKRCRQREIERDISERLPEALAYDDFVSSM